MTSQTDCLRSRLLQTLILATTALPATTSAQLWYTDSNGNPRKWYSTPKIERQRCSIPSNDADRYWAYKYTSLQWTTPFSAMEIDYAMRDVSDCGIELGDGISEIAIDNVVPSTQGILYPPRRE